MVSEYCPLQRFPDGRRKSLKLEVQVAFGFHCSFFAWMEFDIICVSKLSYRCNIVIKSRNSD